MNVKISRVLLTLVCLALFKLAVLGMVSVDSLTHKVADAVIPTPAPTIAKAAEGDNATSAADKTKAAETKADAAAAKKREEVKKGGDMSDSWKALKKKEEELAIRERNLLELKASIEAEAKKVAKMHAEIKAMLDSAKQIKDKRVAQLIAMLSSTKARKAAEILEKMDEDLAVKVLAGMRGRQSGEILSFMSTNKAAKLSEALTRLQIPFETQ